MEKGPLRYFRSIPSLVWGLTFASLGLLIFKTFILNPISEPIPGMNTLGEIVDGLLGSIVASVIFYFVVVHVKEVRDRDAVRPVIEGMVNRLLTSCRQIMVDAKQVTGVPLDFATASLAQIEEAFSQLNPKASVHLKIGEVRLQHPSWASYMQGQARSARREIVRLQAQGRFLDARLASIVARIENAGFFGMTDVMSMNFINTNLSAWADSFYEYLELFRELDSYRTSPEIGDILSE